MDTVDEQLSADNNIITSISIKEQQGKKKNEEETSE